MDFNKAIKQAIGIVKLDRGAVIGVSKDKDAFATGVLIIAIGAILSVLPSLLRLGSLNYGMFNMMRGFGFPGSMMSSASYGSLIGAPIANSIGMFIWAGILFVIAKIFGGKGSYMEYFQPLSYLAILSWLGILNVVPGIGSLISFAAGIWSIVATIIITKAVHSLPTGKAVIVVLIPIIIVAGIAMVVAALALAALGGAGVFNFF